jgi:hypothetical protein
MHSEKFPSAFGWHLISMNITPGEEEGSYAHSIRVGGKLCSLIGLSIINFPHPWAYRLKPTDGGNSQNAELDSATTSS